MRSWKVLLFAALLAEPACAAVSLAPDGTGEGLLFPYATVEQGQTSTLAIRNTRARAKAIKYFVRDTRDGLVVASGTAYVPSKGQWTLTLFDAGEPDRIALRIGDTGCQPRDSDEALTWIGSEGTSIEAWAYRTVSVEIVEVGALDADLSRAMEAGCETIWSRWDARPEAGGRWQYDPRAGVSPPTGGLRGTATLFDADDRTTFDYPALAFRGLSANVRHEEPDWPWPRLGDIEPEADRFIHAVLPDGQRLRYPRKRGTEALAVLLAARHVETEYIVHPLAGERTDVVVVLPFRQGNVDNAASAPSAWPDCEIVTVATVSKQDAAHARAVPLCDRATVLRLRHPAGGSPGDVVGNERAVELLVHRSGMLVIDFADAFDWRYSRPDLGHRCWRGLPAWVLTLAADETIKGVPSRPRTYVRATVPAATSEIVPCG